MLDDDGNEQVDKKEFLKVSLDINDGLEYNAKRDL